MAGKLKRFEEWLEPQADELLTRFIAWKRTAVIIGLILFITHLLAFLAGLAL